MPLNAHHEVHPNYTSIVGAERKAGNYRFIYARSDRIGNSFREDARRVNGKAGYFKSDGALNSFGHSRLDYFEKVRGIEWLI